MDILIKNGRVIDPVNKIDRVTGVLISEDRIVKIGNLSEVKTSGEKPKIIDAKNKVVIPGIIDIHTHLREPGHEEEETIATGTRSAAVGGVTSIFCMPNTHPVIDNQTAVEFILLKAKNEGIVNVFPVGAITKGLSGEDLTEIGELKKAGVVSISDDGNPVMDALVMRRALEYAKMFDLSVIAHCEDKNLSEDGVMNESYTSTLLGLRGIPNESEDVMVARDIILSALTGGHLHIAHVSTKGSVELIRQAKRNKIPVSCEACPHHFTLTDEMVKTYDTNTKVNPPLRTEEDVREIIKGLQDGTIDCIASDHAPHTEEEKNKEYDLAPFGIVGLETLLPLTITYLVKTKKLSLMAAITKLTSNPKKIFKLDSGTLTPGSKADITIIDINVERVIKDFVSKSKNSPFLGKKLQGFAVMTIVNGKIIMDNGKILSD
ncbi:MAG: dihydroorotase [Elusimicrobia bacterium CG1_02_37_114]|nr:MAG: dihydroorotase [Elusimicrobia bacterium CG1_02_37_114]PIZ12647.1 MAG: dihydroorotase [Elusimicrobia bacterium CG_4_10_14_0_8_um_filter_37_32]